MKINKRKIQYASLSTVFMVLFVVAVLLLNVFVGIMTDRFSLILDLTETGEYSISDETKEMLKGINEELTIYIMQNENAIKDDTPQTQVVETVKRYASASGGMIKYEFVDPNQNPKFYDKFPLAKATNDGTASAFLIVSGARRYSSILYNDIVRGNSEDSSMEYSTETELSGAILYVVSPELSKTAVITGHNEMELPGFDRIIEGNGFERIEIDLSKQDIPEGVNNVVIAAPNFDYTAGEIAKIDSFMAKPGSNLYVFWSCALTQQLPVLERFLGDWGLVIETTNVLDQEYCYQIPVITLCQVQANDATARVPSDQKIFLAPQAHPIKPMFDQRSNMRVLPLATTNTTSYARTLTSEAGIVEPRADGEEKGPFVIAAVSEKVSQNSQGFIEEYRVFLFGSEAIADEEIMGLSSCNNSTVLNELVSYANPDAATMSIPPKMIRAYDLNVYESEVNVLMWILVVVMPLVILAVGIFIFTRRRHR